MTFGHLLPKMMPNLAFNALKCLPNLMKRGKYKKGLSIETIAASKGGGFKVSGYLEQRDPSGKKIRVRREFKGTNARDKAVAYRDTLETRDLQMLKNTNYRETKLSEEYEFTALTMESDLREHLRDWETEGHVLLRRAVDFFVNSPRRGTEDLDVSQVSERYQQRDHFSSLSEKHKSSFVSTLNHFCKKFGTRNVATITPEEVGDWINRRKASASTKKKEYAHLHSLFEWAKRQTIVRDNVVTAVDKPRVQTNEPISLSIDQVRQLLFFANQVNHGALIPYFALAIFAALRPEEVKRAKWEDFDWDENLIRATQRKGKGYTRAVELPETCVKWIKHFGIREKGPVTPKNMTKNFCVVRAAAGFRIAEGTIKSTSWWGLDRMIKGSNDPNRPEWVNDVCRHTGITYRLKIIKHVGEVAEWAGNSPEVIQRNYKSVIGVTKASVKEFYSLTPEKVLKANEGCVN